MSPSGNRDNVFITVRPGSNFEYEVNVAADHPSGAFWYHSHRVSSPPGTYGYTVVMRTRYDRYVGGFVMHCHILDHEDQGMMENVLIVPNKDDLLVQSASATFPYAAQATATLAPLHSHY